MKELTALEKTIWNLAMNGGSVYIKKNNDIHKVTSDNLSELLELVDGNEYNPILHSFNKLTEPVLDGGKAPIVELLKLKYKAIYELNKNNRYSEIEYKLFPNYAEAYFKNEATREICVWFKDLNNIPTWITNQLRQWGFNIENLNPDEFIEKSTLKIE